MNDIFTVAPSDDNKIMLGDLSHDEIGDNHIMTGIETPLRKDAFDLSDDEKKKIIALHFSKIMETLGLDLTDDSLKVLLSELQKCILKKFLVV